MNFGGKKIKKTNFYKNKKLFKIDDIDVLVSEKVLVTEKEPCGAKKSFKYFIGYDDNDVIRPLWIKLSQMTGYIKCFDSNKTMYFKISYKKLLKNTPEYRKKLVV